MKDLTDAELIDLVIAAKTAEGHDATWPYPVEVFDDLDKLHQAACELIPAGHTHPLLHMSVWPKHDGPEGILTIELPNGLRLATPSVSASLFRNDQPSDRELSATIATAIEELIYLGHCLVTDYNTAISHPWWQHIRLRSALFRSRFRSRT